jgi:hypothetical protein
MLQIVKWKRQMTRIGTSYFVSRQAAVTYYRDYGATAANVDRKIAEGGIHVGEPTLKPGETLALIDRGLRYAIESD